MPRITMRVVFDEETTIATIAPSFNTTITNQPRLRPKKKSQNSFKVKRVRILPYKASSQSAKNLSQALDAPRIKLKNSNYEHLSGDVIINWGGSTAYASRICSPEINISNHPTIISEGSKNIKVLNPARIVCNIVDKAKFFRVLSQGLHTSNLIPFTSSTATVSKWLENHKVVGRTILKGSGGAGIIILSNKEDLQQHYSSIKLYTMYIKKQDEYRVHIFNGEIFDIQKKKRNLNCDNPNWEIRNHENGFIFARENVKPPFCVLKMATDAMSISCLNFGAVDVIYNKQKDKAYVLEINTAPGLEGETLNNYINVFKNYIETLT